MNNLPIVVAGLGRCGSSLTMQMLAAGGVPCAGRFPDFEVRGAAHYVSAAQLLQLAPPGHAVKILDPHLRLDHQARCRLILLHRNPVEQAKSIAKFTAATIGARYNREQRRRLVSSLERDWVACTRTFLVHQPLIVRFENLLADPRTETERIRDFLHQPFDLAKAEAMVQARSSECRPDLAIELELIRRAA